MTNLATVRTAIPALLTKSLTPPALDRHRAEVAVQMEAMMVKHDKFGWDRLDAPIRKMIRMDWMEALQDYPLDEVRAACRQHTQEQPAKVPNEGHIRAIILRNRARVAASLPKPAEPVRTTPRCEPDTAAAIVEAAGFAPKRFGGDA